MTQCSTLNIKFSKSKLEKLKPATKNATGVTWILSSIFIGITCAGATINKNDGRAEGLANWLTSFKYL